MRHTFFARVKLQVYIKYLKGVESNAKEMLIARSANCAYYRTCTGFHCSHCCRNPWTDLTRIERSFRRFEPDTSLGDIEQPIRQYSRGKLKSLNEFPFSILDTVIETAAFKIVLPVQSIWDMLGFYIPVKWWFRWAFRKMSDIERRHVTFPCQQHVSRQKLFIILCSLNAFFLSCFVFVNSYSTVKQYSLPWMQVLSYL